MKTTKDLTHRYSEVSDYRIYILWNNVYDEMGNIEDPTKEIEGYIMYLEVEVDIEVLELDDAVANYYGFDNCRITEPIL